MIWDALNMPDGIKCSDVRALLQDGSQMDLTDVVSIDDETGDVTRLKRDADGRNYVVHELGCPVRPGFKGVGRDLVRRCTTDLGCHAARETVRCPGIRVLPKQGVPHTVIKAFDRVQGR